MRNLFNEIEIALANIREGWTSNSKAFALAASVIALRPNISLELGVFASKGVTALGLAHKAIGHGKVIGVDPYSNVASSEGQDNPEDKKFWSTVDHEMIYGYAKKCLTDNGLDGIVELVRARSDEYTPPDGIGILRIDGNHGPTAISDAKRYAPKVIQGGFIFCDDLNWTGNYTNKAAKWLLDNGFKSLYFIEDTQVFQKE